MTVERRYSPAKRMLQRGQVIGVQFFCEGCGDLVHFFGVEREPRHGFCATCAYACEFAQNPMEMLDFIKAVNGE